MYLTGKQIYDIQSGKLDAEALGAQLIAKFTSLDLATELSKKLIEESKVKKEQRIIIDKEEAKLIDALFKVVETKEAPVAEKVKKPRKKVEYSPEELTYKTAFMNEVIIKCKGKTEAEKEAIKKAAEKKLAGLKAAAEKAAAARKAGK